MIWYVYTLLALIFFSLSVLIDNYLISKKFKKPSSLMFYSSISNIIFIPLLWIIAMPKIPEWNLIIPLIIVGICEVAYLYPYYKALKIEESSIVLALFSLGKIFIPIIAYFVAGERLTYIHYIGFFLIVFCSFAITKQGRLMFKKSLWYMLATGIILSIHASVYKYNLEKLDWITAMTWTALFSTILIIILALTKFRKETMQIRHKFLKNIHYFITNEAINFIAFALLIYSFSIASVTLVEGLLALQPIILILLVLAGQRFYPKFFKEDISAKSLLRKTFYFLLIAAGIWMILT
ncbi:MAG: EamA family transporter [Candidatus Woesearchaeota archaeon]